MASSELPIGVRPLPSSALTVRRICSLSSGPTGITSSVSRQASSREVSATFEPYTRRPDRRARRQPVDELVDRLLGRVQPRAAVARVLVHRLRGVEHDQRAVARVRRSGPGGRAADQRRSSASSGQEPHRGTVAASGYSAGVAAGDVAHQLRQARGDVWPTSVVASAAMITETTSSTPRYSAAVCPRGRMQRARTSWTGGIGHPVEATAPRGRRQGRRTHLAWAEGPRHA